ncbi:MAG: hypothetical protein AAF799_22505 [Myxococcota bacterium]
MTTSPPSNDGNAEETSDSNAGSGGGDDEGGGAQTSNATAPGTGDPPGDGGDGTGAPPVTFDVGMMPDGGGQGFCMPGMGGGDGGGGSKEPEFSFLWACNSTQGTISKIDTQTVTEVGRYYTRPDLAGSPSRTSVSLSGHVAVANRSGGVTKFYATTEDCVESNGTPGIQTSTDNNPLPWDQEECRAWHIPFDYDSQRPVAWAPGEWNQSTCEWENELLWSAGRWGQTDTEVVLIDGEAGVVLDQVAIPGLKADQFGLYGAAVDSEGNLWTSGWATGNHLVRVDIDTMAVQVWDGPSSTGLTSHWYGMTVDVNGYVWNCASRVARFDPVTEDWTVSNDLGNFAAGCMADGDPDGLLWLGTSGVIRGIDRETFTIVHDWPVPSNYGVSIDFYGNVWAVNGSGAHRVDPDTGTVTSYNGLTGAYTYSDMTGFALNTVGGGGPSR